MRTLFLTLLSFGLLSSSAIAQEDKPDDYVERMEREHASDRPVASPASEVEPVGEISVAAVTYATIEGEGVVGTLARPTAIEPTAGILVIHEWWGLNANVEAMTRQLAGEGYAALAVDLYEGEVAETRDDAGRLARWTGNNRDRVRDNLRQAWQYLSTQQALEKIGVIGWCFGGGWSLQTALMLGDGIDATVIYYGRLVTDRDALELLEAPVLGIFGALDRGIPVATVREFQSILAGLGKAASIHIYEDADHAFANPSGTRYNEKAASDAWQKTLTFFAQLLR